MRADEKIDSQLDLERDDMVAALDQQETAEDVRADEVDTSALHFHELAGFIEALLRGEETDLAKLPWLSDVERQGLALIEAAITGRASGSVGTIFAEDRLVLLNQALATLQPALATGFEGATIEARDLYHTLVEDIAGLKQSLESLSDAQEEMFLHDELQHAHADGKPKPKPPDAGEVGDNRPSTVATGGPAAPEWQTPASMLAAGGPAVPDKPAAPSTLASGGPTAPDWQTPPSTLASGGPIAPDKKPLPSTAWDGTTTDAPDAAPARPRR